MRGLRALAGLAGKLKAAFGDIEVGIDYEAEPGLADNGDLEGDLSALLEQVGRAAKAAKAADTVAVLFIDELQYVEEDQLAALISALHRCAQQQLPVTVVGAGLPQLRGRMDEAKPYAERLFNSAEIGALNAADADLAITLPAKEEGVDVDDAAVARIVAETQGYPYFLQEWGKCARDVAQASPITVADVRTASREAIAALDESFFRVRFDRLTPAEKKYLRAMGRSRTGAAPIGRHRP